MYGLGSRPAASYGSSTHKSINMQPSPAPTKARSSGKCYAAQQRLKRSAMLMQWNAPGRCRMHRCDTALRARASCPRRIACTVPRDMVGPQAIGETRHVLRRAPSAVAWQRCTSCWMSSTADRSTSCRWLLAPFAAAQRGGHRAEVLASALATGGVASEQHLPCANEDVGGICWKAWQLQRVL